MITQTFDLNMIPDSSPVVVHVNQYDVGSGRLIASLYKGETAYTPASGATAMIQGTKPDGHGFQYNATLSGSTVTANLTDQMTAAAGPVRCQIVITEGNNITGTFVFILDVQKSGLPADTDMSASDYQAIEELIQAAIASSANPPIIGNNGHWWIINPQTGEYVDSGIDASITVRIADITMLDPGATPYVTNTGTDTDPIFHLYIPRGATGAKGDTGDAGGFGTPSATIDNNTGTPSVEISASGPNTAKVFSFAFHNLKGNTGAKGDTGDPGPMPTITASGSVDANIGTPSVTVTQTGTAANPNLNFAFHNMKGADGFGSVNVVNGTIVFNPPE